MDVKTKNTTKKTTRTRKPRKKSSTSGKPTENTSTEQDIQNPAKLPPQDLLNNNGGYHQQFRNYAGNGMMESENQAQYNNPPTNGPSQYNPEGYPSNSPYGPGYNPNMRAPHPGQPPRYYHPGATGPSPTLSELLSTPTRYPQPQTYPNQPQPNPHNPQYGSMNNEHQQGNWEGNQMRASQQYGPTSDAQNQGTASNVEVYGNQQYQNQAQYNIQQSRGYSHSTMQNPPYSQPATGYMHSQQYGHSMPNGPHPYQQNNHMMAPPKQGGQPPGHPQQPGGGYYPGQYTRGQYPGQNNMNSGYNMPPGGGQYTNGPNPSGPGQRMETPPSQDPTASGIGVKTPDMGSNMQLNVGMHMKSPGRGTPQPPHTPVSAAPSPMSAGASPLVHPNPTVAHLRTPSAPGSPTMHQQRSNPLSPAPIRPGTPGQMQGYAHHRHQGTPQHNNPGYSSSQMQSSMQSPSMPPVASPAPSHGSMMSPPMPSYSQQQQQPTGGQYVNQNTNRPPGGSTPSKLSQPPTPGTPQSQQGSTGGGYGAQQQNYGYGQQQSSVQGTEFQGNQRRPSWQGQNQVMSPHLSSHGSEVGDPSTPTHGGQYMQQQQGPYPPNQQAQQPIYPEGQQQAATPGQQGMDRSGLGRSGAAAAAAAAMVAAEHSARAGNAPAAPPQSQSETPAPQPRLPYHPNYSNIQTSSSMQPAPGPHESYPAQQQQPQQHYPGQYGSQQPPQGNAMMPAGSSHMHNPQMQRPPMHTQPHHPPPQPNYPGYPPQERMQYPHHPGMQHPGYPGQHHPGKPMYNNIPPSYDDRPKNAQHMGTNILLQKSSKFPETKKSTCSARSASQKLTALYEPEEPGRKEFIDGILKYWEDKELPLKHAPLMGRKTLDLFRLYQLVKERGFMQEVTKSKTWPDICKMMGLGTTSNSGFTLKKQYCKYLYGFECRYERGEPEPPEALGRVAEANRKKKQSEQQASVEAPSPSTPDGKFPGQMGHHGPMPPHPQHGGYGEMPPQGYPGHQQQPHPMPQYDMQGNPMRYPHPQHMSHQQFPGANQQFRQPASMPQYPGNSQQQPRYPTPKQNMYPPHQGQPIPPYPPKSKPQNDPYNPDAMPGAPRPMVPHIQAPIANNVPSVPQQQVKPATTTPLDSQTKMDTEQTAQSTKPLHTADAVAPVQPVASENSERKKDFQEGGKAAEASIAENTAEANSTSEASSTTATPTSVPSSSAPTVAAAQPKAVSTTLKPAEATENKPTAQPVPNMRPYAQQKWGGQPPVNYQPSMPHQAPRPGYPPGQQQMSPYMQHSQDQYNRGVYGGYMGHNQPPRHPGSQHPPYHGSAYQNTSSTQPMVPQAGAVPPGHHPPSHPADQMQPGGHGSRQPWHQSPASNYNRPPYGQPYGPQTPYPNQAPTSQQYSGMKRQSADAYHGPPRKMGRPDDGHHGYNYPRPQMTGGAYPRPEDSGYPPGTPHSQRPHPSSSQPPHNSSHPYPYPQPYSGSKPYPNQMMSPYTRPMTPNMPPRWDRGEPESATKRLQDLRKHVGRSSPNQRHPSNRIPPSLAHRSKITRHITGELPVLSNYPADSVEATRPKLTRNKKKYSKDVGIIEAWHIIMSLKSGLLVESTWALNSLTILLHDEQTLNQISLPQLPGLLDAVVDHFRCCLKELFRLPGELDLCSDRMTTKDKTSFDNGKEDDEFRELVLKTVNSIKHKRVANGLKTAYSKWPVKIVAKELPDFFDNTHKWDETWKGENNHSLEHIIPVYSQKSKHLTKLADRKWSKINSTKKGEDFEPKTVDLKSEHVAIEAVLEDVLNVTSQPNEDQLEIINSDLSWGEKPPSIQLINLSKKKDETSEKSSKGQDEIKEKGSEDDDVSGSKMDVTPQNAKEESKADEEKEDGKDETNEPQDIIEDDLSNQPKNLHIKSCVGKLSKNCNVVLVDDEAVGCPGKGSSLSKYDFRHRYHTHTALNTVFCSDRETELQYRALCLSNIIRSLSCISSNVQELWKHRTLMQILAETLLFRHKHKKRCMARDMVDHETEDNEKVQIATESFGEIMEISEEKEIKMEDNAKLESPKIEKIETDIPMSQQNGGSPPPPSDKDTKENNDPGPKDIKMNGDIKKHIIPNNINFKNCDIKDIKDAIKQNSLKKTDTEEDIRNLQKAISKQKNHFKKSNCVSPKLAIENCLMKENEILRQKSNRSKLFAPKPKVNPVKNEIKIPVTEESYDPVLGKCVFASENNSDDVTKEYYDAWWWDCVHTIRENSIVTLTNLSPFLDITKIADDDVALAILDSCLHWAVCPSSEAKDGFNTIHSRSSLSPQRLVIETLTKLSVKEQNVDLILATKPFSRIEKLLSILIAFIGNRHDRILREFAVVLLSNLANGDPVISRTIALQKGALSTLILFLEECEETGMANRRMLPGQPTQAVNCGTSPYIMLRCAVIINTLSKLPENRPLFLKQQVRLLSLSMSALLGGEVLRKMANTLFELRLI